MQKRGNYAPTLNLKDLFPQGLDLRSFTTSSHNKFAQKLLEGDIAQKILDGNILADLLKINGVRDAVYNFLQNQGLVLNNKKGSVQSLTTQYFDRLYPQNQIHPVQKVMQQRVQSNSKPKQRSDNYKIGLVVEGGGMKGAVTGAMLHKLSQMGFKDCFDVVYGSSAGAINSTYFLSGQTEACNIYTEDICNKDFLDLTRLFNKPQSNNSESQISKMSSIDDDDYYHVEDNLDIQDRIKDAQKIHPSLNLDILLNDVMEKVKPLDYDKVLNSDIPLKAVSSSITSLDSVLLQDFKTKDQLKKALKASANVPVVAGQPVQYEIDGVQHELVDAAVFEIIPFVSAVRDGCTHLLVLCSRPPSIGNYYGQIFMMLIEHLVKIFILNPSYMGDAWKKEMLNIRQNGVLQEDILLLSLLVPQLQSQLFLNCKMLPIYPGSIADYAPTCIDKQAIEVGMQEGREVIEKVLSKIQL